MTKATEHAKPGARVAKRTLLLMSIVASALLITGVSLARTGSRTPDRPASVDVTVAQASEQPGANPDTVRVPIPSAPVTKAYQREDARIATAPLPEETWVETSAETRPNGTIRLYYQDIAYITNKSNRYWMEMVETSHDGRYGMTATYFALTADNRRGERLSESVVWESHSVVNGKRVYHSDRSQLKITLPDGSSCTWSYGGKEAGWFYVKQGGLTVRIRHRTSPAPAREAPPRTPLELEPPIATPPPGASDF